MDFQVIGLGPRGQNRGLVFHSLATTSVAPHPQSSPGARRGPADPAPVPRGGRQVPGVRGVLILAGVRHGAAAAAAQRAGAGCAAPLPGASPQGRAPQTRAPLPAQRPRPGHRPVAARPRRRLQPHLPHRLQVGVARARRVGGGRC